jgi:hypothetical protein
MKAKILLQGSVTRAAYGVLSLLFPRYLFASIGMKRVDDDTRYLNRLFGGRDLVVAAATADAVRHGRGSQAVALNLACEITDTVALVEEIRLTGRLRRALVIGIGFNLLGYATWIRALLAPAAKPAPEPEPVAAPEPAATAEPAGLPG